jgi:hypothetical protein
VSKPVPVSLGGSPSSDDLLTPLHYHVVVESDPGGDDLPNREIHIHPANPRPPIRLPGLQECLVSALLYAIKD